MYTGLRYLIYLKQHHYESYTHCIRVGLLAVFMRAKYGLSTDFTYAAYLHDIGKLYVPESILSKPDKLTSSEFNLLRMHSLWGYQLLAATDCTLYTRKLVLYHHENFNSCGYPYPFGDFSLESNLLSVIDSYDAINSKRVYSDATTQDEALTRLSSGINKQFSREAFDLFVKVLPELKHGTLDASILTPNKTNETSKNQWKVLRRS